jgi:hypothetical protein
MGLPKVEVREFYNGYTPPNYAYRTVRRLVDSVPEKYLGGLECVVLTNQSGHPRRLRLGKVTSRKRRFPQSLVIGRYHHATRDSRAWIELYVDKLAAATGNAWIPIRGEIVFGHVLFHEIGHHIDATIAPEYREKEDVADDWRGRLMLHFLRNKYWYIWPLRKQIAPLLRAWAKSL